MERRRFRGIGGQGVGNAGWRMSSKGQETATLNSTKQLLDELDALMEKMLALPVSSADDAAPLPEELARLPRVTATLTVLESAAPDLEQSQTDTAGLSALASSPRVDEPAKTGPPHVEFDPKRASPSHKEESLASPARSPSYMTNVEAAVPEEAIPPSLLNVQVPEIEVLPVRPRPWASVAIQPLLLVNGIFDLLTFFLGPLGRWLRTGPGRSFLAFAGVVLAVLGIGWLIRDWMSWTQ